MVHAATAQPNQPTNAYLDVFQQHVDLAVNYLRNRFVKNRHLGCIYRQYMCEVCYVMYEPVPTQTTKYSHVFTYHAFCSHTASDTPLDRCSIPPIHPAITAFSWRRRDRKQCLEIAPCTRPPDQTCSIRKTEVLLLRFGQHTFRDLRNPTFTRT